MPYPIDMPSLEQRVATVASRIGKNPEKRPFKFFSRDLNLPVIHMPIDGLVYRMKNGRTRTEQGKYLREHGKAADFFAAGQENVSAQRAQHAILLKFAESSKGRVLPEVLRKDKRQTEPLLITRQGVVLNGNRRLALMRELLQDDRDNGRSQYSTFETIECLVLDEGMAEAELREIEIRLQGARETKLDYDWIDEILLARDLLGDGKTAQQVADFQNMSEKELKTRLRMLDEADLYVKQYHADRGGMLDLLRDEKGAEQQFIELVEALRSVPEELQNQARAVHYVLTANPSESGRKYNYRIAYGQRELPKVLERIAKREGVAIQEAAVIVDEDDPFADDAIPGGTTFVEITAWLSDQKDSHRKAKVIREVVDEIVAEREDEQRETRALRRSKESLEILNRIDLREASAETLAELDSVLSEIKAAAVRLQAELQVLY